MKLDRTAIAQFCQLTLMLAKVDFKTKTEGSYLGIFWHLLNPIIYFLVLFFIFQNLTGKEIANYPSYLLSGIIIFRFFQATTTESTTAIIKSESAIRALNFNPYSIPLAVILSNIFSHFIEAIIMLGWLIYFHSISWTLLWYPIMLVLLTLCITGLALFLSAISVLFMDTVNIWGNMVRVAWLATPIFYSTDASPLLEIINQINPMFYFIAIVRTVAIDQAVPPLSLLLPVVIFTVLLLTIGLITFSLLKKKFAENL